MPLASFLSGEPQQYVGQLFLLLLVQVATGIVIAGTDLFWPPFGGSFAAWLAAPGVDPSLVVPGATNLSTRPLTTPCALSAARLSKCMRLAFMRWPF